jgi:hypothetical protein
MRALVGLIVTPLIFGIKLIVGLVTGAAIVATAILLGIVAIFSPSKK